MVLQVWIFHLEGLCELCKLSPRPSFSSFQFCLKIHLNLSDKKKNLIRGGITLQGGVSVRAVQSLFSQPESSGVLKCTSEPEKGLSSLH